MLPALPGCSRRVLRACPVLLSALLASLLALPSAPGFAQEEPEVHVELKADSFRYDRRTRILTASGHVVLTVEDVVISADALIANLETGAVVAQGNVSLEVKGQSIAAEQLDFNVNTHFGVLTNAATDYTGPLVLGSIHLGAQRVEGDPSTFLRAKEAFLTTCNKPEACLHLTADEVSVFLNDKIVGRQVSVWAGIYELFTLPYFLISLRERQVTRVIPLVGYNDVEGWYVKTAYSYFVNDDQHGFLYGDGSERLGVGTGVEHFYRGGGGQGSAFVYRLADRQTGGADMRTVFNHLQQFDQNTKVRLYVDFLDQTFVATPSISTLFTALDVSTATPSSSTFVFSTSSNSSVGPTSTLTSRLVHSQVVTPELAGEAVVDFNRTSTVIGRHDELSPRLTLRYLRPGYTASLVAETRWDLSGGPLPSFASFTLERLPELTVALAPMRLGETSLVGQLEGGIARFRETTVGIGARTLDAGRLDLLATVSGLIELSPERALGVHFFARQNWYSTGDARLYYGGRVDHTIPLTDRLGATFGYARQIVQGDSPFVFDQILTTTSVADAGVVYQAPNLFLRATGSYDFLTRQAGNVVAQAVYLPRPAWNLGLAASYNVLAGRLDRLEATLDLRLSDEWQFQYIGAFDGIAQQVIHDQVSLTRIFCECLAVGLTYRGARNEIWLESWLTALPWARGRLGIGGRGNLLFDQPIPFIQQP